MKLEKYLITLGLSKKEISVYTSLLNAGESNSSSIVKRTSFPRTTVIYLLEKLEKRGLIEIMQTKSGKKYLPIAPRKIVTLLKNKKTNLEERIQSFEEAVPELNRLYKRYVKEPQIRFFRGKKEIQSMYKEVLESLPDEIVYVGSVEEIEEFVGRRFLHQWVRSRIEKGIKVRAIRIEEKEKGHDLYDLHKELLKNVRFAPEWFQCPSHFQIYGDNVTIVTTEKENIGINISSRDIATTMRNCFNAIWKISSDPSRKKD